MTINVLLFSLWLLAAPAARAEAADTQAPQGDKEMSGIAILGNREAPKSLVIVPWKSSEIGNGIDVSNMLDDRARPVDRDVFARELGYYELRSDVPPRDVSISDASRAAGPVAQH